MTELLKYIMSDNMLLVAQCVLFVVLNILDGYTTWLVMKPNHCDRERNPIARWVFKTLKPPASIIFFKALVLGFLGDFIAYWWNEALTINLALLIGNLLFIFVVHHNYKVHKKYIAMEKAIEDIQRIKWVVE